MKVKRMFYLVAGLFIFLSLVSIKNLIVSAEETTTNQIIQETKYIIANVPGKYEINSAYFVEVKKQSLFKVNTTTITILLENIEVSEDLSLKFNFLWSAKADSGSYTATKYSDKGNKKMYLMDDKGNKYHHTKGEGAAYKNVSIMNRREPGAFYFPSVVSDCKFITFYDDDQNKTIGPIEIKY